MAAASGIRIGTGCPENARFMMAALRDGSCHKLRVK